MFVLQFWRVLRLSLLFHLLSAANCNINAASAIHNWTHTYIHINIYYHIVGMYMHVHCESVCVCSLHCLHSVFFLLLATKNCEVQCVNV